MTDWLIRLNSTPPRVVPRLRVIALPHAGGWPSAFRAWQQVLPADVELRVAQLPGRALRLDEPPLRQVEPLVQGLCHAAAALPALPSVVVGHSFGSVLAYELTKALEARGMAPRLLVVSARQPPCFPSEPPFAHLKTDAQLLDHLVDIGGIAPELVSRTDLVTLALASVRADLQAMETYPRPASGTAVPILALGAFDDPVVIEERLHLWSLETSDRFTRLMFSGGHFYIYQPGTAAVIAQRMIAELAVLPAGNGEMSRLLATPVADIPGRHAATL